MTAVLLPAAQGGKKHLKPLQQKIRLTRLAPTGAVLGRSGLSTCQPLLFFITVIRGKNLISVSRVSAIPRLLTSPESKGTEFASKRDAVVVVTVCHVKRRQNELPFDD
jgi:hypothetical protein